MSPFKRGVIVIGLVLLMGASPSLTARLPVNLDDRGFPTVGWAVHEITFNDE